MIISTVFPLSARHRPGRMIALLRRKGLDCAGGMLAAGRFGLFLGLLLAVFLQAAIADPKLPHLDGRVVDTAHILDPDTVQHVTADLAAYEAKTSTQIVVVTLPDLQGYPIEQWGLALLRGWQIGQKGKNNGVVVIVAPNDHQMRIETGYGAEGPLPDATASQIIRQDMTPHFKQGDYAGGLTAGLHDIESALQGEFHADNASSSGSDSQADDPDDAQPAGSGAMKWIVLSWFALAGVMIVVGQWRIRKRRRSGRNGGRGDSSSSSSSSSSDSFSGGGGSGGGGGASGSW
jgi:uncharacterized protein